MLDYDVGRIFVTFLATMFAGFMQHFQHRRSDVQPLAPHPQTLKATRQDALTS